MIFDIFVKMSVPSPKRLNMFEPGSRKSSSNPAPVAQVASSKLYKQYSGEIIEKLRTPPIQRNRKFKLETKLEILDTDF
jgi:hypothetical protein